MEKVQEYLAKIKHYWIREKKANKDKALIQYVKLLYIYMNIYVFIYELCIYNNNNENIFHSVKLTEQINRFPRSGLTYLFP